MQQPHYSVSLSVYSPVESERRSTFFTNDPVIEEENEDEHEYDQSSELFGSDYNEDGSQSSTHSKNNNGNGILPETSSQTFRSYYTATNGSEPSFSSINNSLLRQDSNDQSEQDVNGLIDPDETPRLNTEMHGTNDSIFDKTPVFNTAGVFDNQQESSTSNGVSKSSSHVELPQKFKRLSVTLLQTGSHVSRESHIFHNNFSSNAHKAQAQNQHRTSRTSLLYKKIHEKNDTPTPPAVVNDEDTSVLSTSSNLSSAPMRHDVLVDPDNSQDDVPPRGDLQTKFTKPAGGLNIVYGENGENSSANNSGVDVLLDRIDPSRWSVASSTTEDEDMSSLFIRALHSFDATQSQLESENSVCLSFEKNDIAFVHTIDDSGWGEVILIETLERGWVPMNYFAMAITSLEANQSEEVDSDEIKFSHFMFPLLNACGRFLSNPLSRDGPKGKTFSNKHLNDIKDGVRCLLDETDCLSRSSEIIVKKPVVRKARKAFMYDWWELMKKAAEYKGTTNFEKVEILTLFVLLVIRRGVYFFDVWLTESKDILQKEAEKRLRTDMNTYPLLHTPPLAKQRVTEIKGILYSYLSLIMGRLDLIEHNPQGCELLEKISCHILLLLSELLFISKTGLEYTSSKSIELDASMDAFMSFGDQLVTCVKVLINKTVGEDKQSRVFNGESSQDNQDYTFTEEGVRLRQVAARTIKAINSSVRSINELFDNIGDFKLSLERSYPDYLKMRIDPADFIRQCSVGMVQSHSLKNKDLRVMKKKNGRSTNRYSMFRSGKAGGLGMTPNGVDLLHKVMLLDTDDTPFNASTAEFQPFIASDSTNNKAYTIKDELLVDANGTLLGASFKGLIYTLTNEDSPPQYFFISGFFICLRSFASGIDLLEGLISRFEENNGNGKDTDNSDALLEVRLKKRRRLIIAIFKIWMESFWDYEADSPLLCTLVNFFNEGIYPHLPLDAMKLIEIAAKLSIKETKGRDKKQMVERHVTLKKFNRKDSGGDLRDLEDSSRYSIVEDNELSRISSSSSISSSLKSMTLGLSLSGLGTSAGTLLTKTQQATVETTVAKFRQVLGDAWCPRHFIEARSFATMPLKSMLPTWFNLCEEKWALDQYRPNLLDFQVLELSNQLTLIESEIFCSIKSSELLFENYTAKKAHLKLANNVRQSLLFTNCLSGYVLESILQPGLTDKQRVNQVKQWLKVGFSCFEMRNFNSMVAIITSLQSHLITRVKRLWDELPPKYTHLYEYLCNVAHPQNNFNVYREKLRFFLENSEYNYPVVPYFSLFLQDLTFVTDGNPNYRKANTFLNQKLINIDKHLKLTRVIADIESLQVRYVEEDGSRRRSRFSLNLGKNNTADLKIVSNPALQELVLLEFFKIAQLNKGEEDRAWKLSCELQPRDTPRVS